MLINTRRLHNGRTQLAPLLPTTIQTTLPTFQSHPACPPCPDYAPPAHENTMCIHVACHVIDDSCIPCSGPLWNTSHSSAMTEHTPRHTRMAPKHFPATQLTPGIVFKSLVHRTEKRPWTQPNWTDGNQTFGCGCPRLVITQLPVW